MSEEAVLVVEEHEVDDVVGSLHGLFVSSLPHVVSKHLREGIDFGELLWNPFSEALFGWSLVESTHSVESLVASGPQVLEVEAEVGELQLAIFCNQYVLWFDISMNKIMIMGKLNSLNSL